MTDRTRQDAVHTRILENPIEESRYDGETTITLERRIAREPEWVWRMLTTTDGAARWTPCVPVEHLAGPGPAAFRESASSVVVPSEVTDFQPDVRLRHSWGESALTWDLSPADGYTDLLLTQDCSSRESTVSNAAGWHVCLAVLEALGDGDDVARVVGEDAMGYGFTRLQSEYAEHYRLIRV